MTTAAPTRDRILNAVMNLIRDGGVHAVTLSAVCRLAAISKGGLIHHFPSKDALIEAFLDRAAGQYLEWIAAQLANVTLGQGRWTLAWLDLFLRDTRVGKESSTEDLGDEQCTAVMLALIQSSGRSGMAKSLFDHVFDCLRADGLSLDLATTLLVTMDGFWFQSVVEDPDELPTRMARLRRQLQKAVRAEVHSRQEKKVSQRKVRKRS
jgi:AcrR family transcriptional regulator